MSQSNVKKDLPSTPTSNVSQSAKRMKFIKVELVFVLMDSTELTKFATNVLKDFTMTSRLWTANHCVEPTLNSEMADASVILVSS